MRRMKLRVLSSGDGVIQICWMAPGPVISASVKVACAATFANGETFHPCPSSRAGPRAGPFVDIAAMPFSPVKFSGLMDRDCAFDTR